MEGKENLRKSIKWIVENIPVENFKLFHVYGSKTPNALAIDLDEDGIYEIVCYDFDEDGEIDTVEYYNKYSNRVRTK